MSKLRVISFICGLSVSALMELIGGSLEARAQDLMDMSKRCERVMHDGGMAGYRACQWEAWERIAERIRGSECTRTKCYFKLLRASRVSKTVEGRQEYLISYKGEGFTFVELGSDFKTGNEEVPYDGAILIDREGRLSIIGRCTGNGCSVRSFARGQHRDAEVYGPFGSQDDPRIIIVGLPR